MKCYYTIVLGQTKHLQNCLDVLQAVGTEPAQPQWPQDFKYHATLQNATKQDILEQREQKSDFSAHQKRAP
jgi:hypothetical protein